MNNKRKKSPLTEYGVRIRFANTAQHELIKSAAKMHGLSFNAFVIRVSEDAAKQLLKISPVDVFGETSAAVAKSLSGK